MSEENKKKKQERKTIEEERVITDPQVVPVLFHEKKKLILKLLVEKERTIIDIKKLTGLNPGTIKRHINDLIKYDLIFIARTEINENSILMKYYRSKAKKFRIELSWP